jgi:uncharacterized Fe-S center protein
MRDGGKWMKGSDVYFADLHVKWGDSILMKFERLLKAAGMEKIDMERKFVAIKTHFGEPGNMSILRPNYSRVVADMIEENGGYPFLTDANTLYPGRRKHALEHMDAANENGFLPAVTGCQIIIADGLKGSDDIEIPVNGDHIGKAKIGRAIADSDVLISLTHFKGHELTGFGGAIKNIGMGSASRAGKMEMHSAGKPSADPERCKGCGRCLKACAHGAITVSKKADIDHSRCTGCGRCIASCTFDAVSAKMDEANDILNRKIVEYTAAVVRGRPCFHISLAIDISPFCDCHADNDVPIVPNVGMFASFDPVALDKACADMVNRQPVIEGSLLAGSVAADRFTGTHPTTDWRTAIEHAVKMKLGSADYRIVRVE